MNLLELHVSVYRRIVITLNKHEWKAQTVCMLRSRNQLSVWGASRCSMLGDVIETNVVDYAKKNAQISKRFSPPTSCAIRKEHQQQACTSETSSFAYPRLTASFDAQIAITSYLMMARIYCETVYGHSGNWARKDGEEKARGSWRLTTTRITLRDLGE